MNTTKLMPRAQRQEPVEPPLVPQVAQDGPFRRANEALHQANEDLAVAWDKMKSERDAALNESESLRTKNIYLSERVDSLTRELAVHQETAAIEVAHLRKRADDAVAAKEQMAGKFDLIGRSIRMVLDENVVVGDG